MTLSARPIHRRTFLQGALAFLTVAALPASTSLQRAARLVAAARGQIGVTTGYDPAYVQIPYPNGDVPRATGVCADVIIRAYRDALGQDLQMLVHEDRKKNALAYFRRVGISADTNIDQRRVVNLETFFKHQGACLWQAADKAVAGDAFPMPLRAGDLLTWQLPESHTHIALVAATGEQTSVVHNIGRGAEEVALADFQNFTARGHYRWLPG